MASEAEQKRIAGEIAGKLKGGEEMNVVSKCSCKNISLFTLHLLKAPFLQLHYQ